MSDNTYTMADVRAALAEIGGDERSAADTLKALQHLRARGAGARTTLVLDESDIQGERRPRGHSVLFAHADRVVTTGGLVLKDKFENVGKPA